MKLHYFQHVPYEGLDRIADWAAARGHAVSCTRLFAGENPPEPSAYDGLLIMGGPQGAYEDALHPWMAGEKAAIRAAIASGKPVLGICLGSQLLASVLGARVYPHTEKEIGWWPVKFDVSRTRGTPLEVFGGESVMYHWHGDTFDLPAGATHVATSAACAHQAFLYKDKVMGLQFHPEISADTIDRWVAESTSVHHPKRFVMGVEEMNRQAPQHLTALQPTLNMFLDRFFHA